MSVTRGHLWRGIGYGLTAAWMIGILFYTGSNPAHPWFDYIFVVPLVCWIVVLGAVRLLGPARDPANPERDRRRPPPGPDS